MRLGILSTMGTAKKRQVRPRFVAGLVLQRTNKDCSSGRFRKCFSTKAWKVFWDTSPLNTKACSNGKVRQASFAFLPAFWSVCFGSPWARLAIAVAWSSLEVWSCQARPDHEQVWCWHVPHRSWNQALFDPFELDFRRVALMRHVDPWICVSDKWRFRIASTSLPSTGARRSGTGGQRS